MNLSLTHLQAIIFDFDGVLTDNAVYVDQNGVESVRCSRSDGLAFDALRKTSLALFILSTEKNPVVTARAAKLRLPVIQNCSNKKQAILDLVESSNYSLDAILFVGNDLNDYRAMETCGFSACPGDSHPHVKDLATFVLKTNGGQGIVRELLEDVLGLDMLGLLEKTTT